MKTTEGIIMYAKVIKLGAKGIKAGVKAKAQGAETKVAIAKGINASTGIKVTTIVKAIDIAIDKAPVVKEKTKKVVYKVKNKVK